MLIPIADTKAGEECEASQVSAIAEQLRRWDQETESAQSVAQRIYEMTVIQSNQIPAHQA